MTDVLCLICMLRNIGMCAIGDVLLYDLYSMFYLHDLYDLHDLHDVYDPSVGSEIGKLLVQLENAKSAVPWA